MSEEHDLKPLEKPVTCGFQSCPLAAVRWVRAAAYISDGKGGKTRVERVMAACDQHKNLLGSGDYSKGFSISGTLMGEKKNA